MPRRTTSEPLQQDQKLRRGLGTRGELALAVLPTGTILLVMAFIEALSTQRLLFASLASSAFLIYLDPHHATNQVRTLVLAQLSAALIGWLVHFLVGPGYSSAGISMVIAILLMVTADAVHPPAVSTAMSFGLRAGETSDLALFMLSLLILCVLVVLQQVLVWLMVRFQHRNEASGGGQYMARGEPGRTRPMR